MSSPPLCGPACWVGCCGRRGDAVSETRASVCQLPRSVLTWQRDTPLSPPLPMKPLFPAWACRGHVGGSGSVTLSSPSGLFLICLPNSPSPGDRASTYTFGRTLFSLQLALSLSFSPLPLFLSLISRSKHKAKLCRSGWPCELRRVYRVRLPVVKGVLCPPARWIAWQWQ